MGKPFALVASHCFDHTLNDAFGYHGLCRRQACLIWQRIVLIFIGGEPAPALRTPRVAQDHGIVTVFQEVLVAEARSVLDNVKTFPFPVANVVVAFSPGAQDTMMVLALALHLDPVFVGAHHVARFLVVTITVALAARRLAKDNVN